MKQERLHLTLHQKVWAIIEDVMEPQALIVSFQGDLVRVHNQSGKIFRSGQRIQLKVTLLNPLQFQLVDTKSSQAAYYSRLDITI